MTLSASILQQANSSSIKEISNLTERLKNSESDTRLCQDQIKTRDNQIELLKDEVSTLKTKRNIAYGAGALGIIIGVLVVVLTH